MFRACSFPSEFTRNALYAKTWKLSHSLHQCEAVFEDETNNTCHSRLTPHSTSELTSLNIRHILCISRPQDVPKFKFPDSTSNSRHYFLIRQIEVSDTSTEDVLCHLKKACSWIDSKLQPSTNPKDGNVLESSGVLIHCPQGIRRAGTCAVAFGKS